MFEAFLSLQPPALIAISILVPVLIAIPFSLVILKRTIPSFEGDAVVLGPMVSFVGTAFALLQAFVIVTVWSSQTASQQVLFAELTSIEDVLIEARMVAPERAAALNEAATKYLDLMRNREILATAPSGGDRDAERAFEAALKLIRDTDLSLAADPARQVMAGTLRDEARQWIESRELRVNSPPTQLDAVMTALLMVLALLTVASVGLLPSTTTAWAKWAQTVGVALAVGISMSLVFYISSHAFTRDAEDQQIARVQDAIAARPAADQSDK